MYVDLMRPASKSSPEDSRSWTLESGLGSGSLYLSSVLLQVNVTSLTTHVFSFPFVACMLHSVLTESQSHMLALFFFLYFGLVRFDVTLHLLRNLETFRWRSLGLCDYVGFVRNSSIRSVVFRQVVLCPFSIEVGRISSVLLIKSSKAGIVNTITFV